MHHTFFQNYIDAAVENVDENLLPWIYRLNDEYIISAVSVTH